MSEGVIQPDGKTVVFPGPVMEGLACEVQHTMSTGRPYTAESGQCGFGTVTLPTGQPRVVMQVRHPDGSSLSVTLKFDDVEVMLECLLETAADAHDMAEAASRTARQ